MLFQTITLSIVLISLLSKFIVDKDLQVLYWLIVFINRNSRKYLYDFLLLH